jgi:hypothetical protein
MLCVCVRVYWHILRVRTCMHICTGSKLSTYICTYGMDESIVHPFIRVLTGRLNFCKSPRQTRLCVCLNYSVYEGLVYILSSTSRPSYSRVSITVCKLFACLDYSMYWRLQNNCSPSDRFITVQCHIFAPNVLFGNVYSSNLQR